MVQSAQLTPVLVLLSFMDYFAVSMVAPQLGMRIRELGASHLFIGMISSSYGAVQLFSSTLHGVCCDKYGRRVTLLLCCVVISGSYLLLAISTSFVALLVVRSVLGMVKHTQSSFKVIGGDINTGSARSVFISKLNSFSGLAFMTGPLVAAYFHAEHSFMYSAITCSSVFVIITLLAYWLVSETLPPGDVTTTTRDVTMTSGTALSIIQRFKKYKSLRCIFIYRFCAATSVIILRHFTPLYTQHYFGFNARDASYMTSFVGFSGIVCSYSAGYVARLVPDKMQLLRYLSLSLILAVGASLLSTNMTSLLMMQLLLSFSSQNLRIVVDAVILAAATDRNRGEVFGLGGSVIGLCRVGGPLVAGCLADVHMLLPLVASLVLACSGSVALFLHAGEKEESKKEE